MRRRFGIVKIDASSHLRLPGDLIIGIRYRADVTSGPWLRPAMRVRTASCRTVVFPTVMMPSSVMVSIEPPRRWTLLPSRTTPGRNFDAELQMLPVDFINGHGLASSRLDASDTILGFAVTT